MPWSAGTFSRNNGSTSGATAWAQLDAGGEAILSPRHDTADQDLATGINETLHKGGQNTPTANLPMGGFKHTGVANGTATNHYAAVGQVQNSSFHWAGTSSGDDTITASLTPNLTAYADGQVFRFIAGGTNTGAATLNINSVGAADIKKGGAGTTALAAGDIAAGGIYTVIYNDTTDDFELQNPQTSFGDAWSSAVDSDIVPTGNDSTYDLGTSTDRFADAFIDDLEITTSIELGHATDTTLTRSGAGVVAVEGSDLAKAEPGVNPQTGTSYTLALTDKGGVVTMSNSSANTVTIPANASVAFPTNTIINILQIGTGVTSVEGDTGVTLNGVSAGSGDFSNQFQGVSLLKTATNTWIASGSIGTVS